MIVRFEIARSQSIIDRFVDFRLRRLRAGEHAFCKLELRRPVRISERCERYSARTLGVGKKSVAYIDSNVCNRSISGSLEEYHIAELHRVPRYRSPQYRLHRCSSRKID